MIYCIGEIIVQGVKFSKFEALGYDEYDVEANLKDIVSDVTYMDSIVEACTDAVKKAKKEEINVKKRYVKLFDVLIEWDTPDFIIDEYNKKYSDLQYCKGCEEFQPNQLAHSCLYEDLIN